MLVYKSFKLAYKRLYTLGEIGLDKLITKKNEII